MKIALHNAHRNTKSEGYLRARGGDEALAGPAETLQAEPTGYANNSALARSGETALTLTSLVIRVLVALRWPLNPPLWATRKA